MRIFFTIVLLSLIACSANDQQKPDSKQSVLNTPQVASSVKAASSSVQSPGWGDVIQLKQLSQDIEKVTALPTGGGDCGSQFEGDDGEEPPTFRTKKERIAYERSKQQEEQERARGEKECEITQAKQSTVYEAALNNLNHTWIPVLKRAVDLGDPVAEVILRLCDTAPILDRTGIASSCAEKEEDRKFARTRLEAINFRPALYGYNLISQADAPRNCNINDSGSNEFARCVTQSGIDRYKQMLEIIRTGYLGVVEDFNTCQVKGMNEELDRLAEECQRLLFLTEVTAYRSSRSYAPNLTLTHKEEYPRIYLAWNPNHVTRLNWSEFRDPDFQSKFDLEVKKNLAEINANIESDLKKEPRWGIFLMNRIVDRTEEQKNTYVSKLGLTWMPINSSSRPWASANAYCTNTAINGQTGWRLPTKDELKAFYDSGAMKGQGWTLHDTWSSTPSGSGTSYSVGGVTNGSSDNHYGTHYGVHMDYGGVDAYPDTLDIYVTCVR